MTKEPIEVTRQDRIYCLKVSSDYHSEVCEECKFYPNCDHMTQDDMTELTIKDLETLEQRCEDAVSRQAVLNTLFYKSDNNCEVVLNKELQDRIKALPSVTPTHIETVTEFADRCMECGKQKKGKWIDTGEIDVNRRGQIVHEVICSECNGISYFRSMGNKYIGANLCPNCGSRNEVEE